MIDTISGIEKALESVLIDSVESGASVGFLRPIVQHEIIAYWQGVENSLQAKERKLFVAVDNGEVIGTVQLALCAKANGSHRGEVEKLMVKTNARGKGVSKKLMAMLELVSKDIGLSLLVLDTRFGDIASDLYRNIGYLEAGKIPRFARSSNGQLEATVYFYKLL